LCLFEDLLYAGLLAIQEAAEKQNKYHFERLPIYRYLQKQEIEGL
jgi:hypothetical protein